VGAGRTDADFENVENADHDVFSLILAVCVAEGGYWRENRLGCMSAVVGLSGVLGV